MTGRTHDLAAFTTLNVAFIAMPIMPTMSLATLGAALTANMIGGLLPDIDGATSDIWDKIRGGSILGKIIKPLIGGHRMISHSILGMIIVGALLQLFLTQLGTVLLVDMNIVWWSTMIGYFSHLATDSMTKEGVPWLFPIPIRFGFPPFRFMRIKTSGIVEKSVVLPGLILLNTYLFYLNYGEYELFIKEFVK